MSPPPLRLLHTSDVHIGDEGRSEKRLDGLRGVVDVAIETSVDALLIVGDLFDSTRVADEQIDAALAELARLKIPTVVTCGNHDQLDEPSIHARVSFSDAGEHVQFAAHPEGDHVVLHDVQLAIWSRGMVDHCPEHRPLDGYMPYPGDFWQIALAHGHYVEEPGVDLHRSSRIGPEEIAALECDYLALGHWHRFFDATTDGVPAFYCGSPSEAGGSFASANLIALQPGRSARVERVSVPTASPRGR